MSENSTYDDIEKRVWKDVLLINLKGERFKNFRSIPQEYHDKKIQLFEALVTEAIFTLDNRMKWSVTQVSRDNGIDFKGVESEVIIPNLFKLPERHIVGQVKRREKQINTESINSDFYKIANYIKKNENVYAILYVFSSLNEDKNIELLKGNHLSAEGRRVVFVKGENFIVYWAHNRKKLLEILKDNLSVTKLNDLNYFLDQRAKNTTNNFELTIEGNAYGVTGNIVERTITITSKIFLPVLKVRLIWEQDKTEKNAIEVLEPIRLLKETGEEIVIKNGQPQKINIKLRCFANAKVSLGNIALIDDTNNILVEKGIGIIKLEYQFNPKYFREPNIEIEAEMSNIISIVKAGKVKALAILGMGGSGKSRLCEELVENAVKHEEFKSAVISHPLNKVSSNDLIISMFYHLLNSSKRKIEFLNDLIDSIKDIMLSEFKKEWEISLEKLFKKKSLENLDHDNIAKSLFTIILNNTKEYPLIFHLKDLHWGDEDTFYIIETLIKDLQNNEIYLSNGVCFLLEGRNKEAQKIDENYYSPHDWFNFLSHDFLIKKEVAKWNKSNSKLFLKTLFNESINKNDYLDPEKIVMFSEMINHILKWSQGNPMHIVEQLRLLYHKGFIKLFDNGLLYLHSRLPNNYEVPTNTLGVINERIAYFNKKYPSLVQFLIFISKVSKKIPILFFDHLVEQCFKEQKATIKETLMSMDFVSISSHGESGVEFYHENYYQIFYKKDLDNPEFVDPALEYYEYLGKTTSLTEEQILEKVSISFLNPVTKINFSHLTKTIIDTLVVCKNDFININFYEYLEKIPENILLQQNYYSYTIDYNIASILIRIGDWHKAKERYQKVEDCRDKYINDNNYLKYLLPSMAEIVHVLTDSMEFESAFLVINQALSLCNQIENITVDEYLFENKRHLWNKMAVIHWFSGNVNEAIKWQNKCHESAKKDIISFSSSCRELGTMMLHVDLEEGVNLLKQALVSANEVNNIHYQLTNIINVHLLIGRLLIMNKRAYKEYEIRALLKETNIQHENCLKNRSVLSATVSSMVCGTCHAVLNELKDAKYWFNVSVNLATFSNLNEVLWKARLNLAQVCYAINKDDPEIRLHSNEAAELLIRSLNIKNKNIFNSRLELVKHPLLNILRLNNNIIVRQTIIDLFKEFSSNINYQEYWEHRHKLLDKENTLSFNCLSNEFYLLT